jgi:hypothetical protein
MSLLRHVESAYRLAHRVNPQVVGVSAMLKELNAIASGLLGLEGYPTKPLWSNGASRREAGAELRPSIRAPEHRAPATDDRPHGRPALNC